VVHPQPQEEPMIRKLSLDLESLTVTSFDTSDERAQAGSVNGHEGKVAAAVTEWAGCVPGCNTRLTCSTNLC
jgi:hypothetical protein